MSSESGKMQAIEISKLNIQQLNQVKQQVDQELGFFSDSLQQLKAVQNKFIKSLESVAKMAAAKSGAEVLVPLSGSLYMPGRLERPEKVLVNVGAGYYLEKASDEAEKYFRRRIQHVTLQMQKIQDLGIQKQRVRDAVQETMETRLQQMTAKSAQASAATPPASFAAAAAAASAAPKTSPSSS